MFSRLSCPLPDGRLPPTPASAHDVGVMIWRVHVSILPVASVLLTTNSTSHKGRCRIYVRLTFSVRQSSMGLRFPFLPSNSQDLIHQVSPHPLPLSSHLQLPFPPLCALRVLSFPVCFASVWFTTSLSACLVTQWLFRFFCCCFRFLIVIIIIGPGGKEG